MSKVNPKPILDNVPDADEDVDDLDDVLDQFSPPSEKQPPAPPPTSTFPPMTTTGRPRHNTRVDVAPTSLPGSSGSKMDPFSETDEDELSTAFSRELANGMESLMRELVDQPDQDREITGGASEGKKEMTEEEKKAFKAAWEAILIEGLGGPTSSEESLDKGRASGETATFQSKIKQTIDKLKENESKFQEVSGSGLPPATESVENLLHSLGDLDLGGDADNELADLLEKMMTQLLNKDVLYDPLKELADGFPSYLANPPQPLSTEDEQRYEKQLVCVKKILEVFEKPDFSDSHQEYGKQIVDLMSEMQSYGPPPAEIMGPLPPEFDGLDKLTEAGDQSCIIS